VAGEGEQEQVGDQLVDREQRAVLVAGVGDPADERRVVARGPQLREISRMPACCALATCNG
jgi:hypothetical protein